MLKCPMLMTCGHNVCRECVIDRESEDLPIICFYDNNVAKSINDVEVNSIKLKMIEQEAKEDLEKHMKTKIV